MTLLQELRAGTWGWSLGLFQDSLSGWLYTKRSCPSFSWKLETGIPGTGQQDTMVSRTQ